MIGAAKHVKFTDFGATGDVAEFAVCGKVCIWLRSGAERNALLYAGLLEQNAGAPYLWDRGVASYLVLVGPAPSYSMPTTTHTVPAHFQLHIPS